MKIAFIAPIRLPTERAHGYAVLKMCETFAKQGNDVTLIVPDKTTEAIAEKDPFKYYGIKPLFSIRRLETTDFLGKRNRSSSIPYVLDLFSFLFAVRNIPFSKETVVYTRDYLVALFVPSKNVFLELHTIPTRTILLRRALRRARGVITISKGIRDTLLELDMPPEKIIVAPDAVALEDFSSSPSRSDLWSSLGVDPNKKIVLYTGHLYDWKGAETLGNAAKALSSDVQVVFVGGIDEEFRRFKETYTASNITLIPFQNRSLISSLLQNADLLVLPNSGKAAISRLHTSPLKLFEYMASKTPILASDLPSIREILDEESAFWFTPDDSESLSQALSYVLTNREEGAKRALRARAIVERYTWDTRGKLITSHLSERHV